MNIELIAKSLCRSRITGHGTVMSVNHSLPLYLAVPFSAAFVQESSLLTHLWIESEMLDAMDFGFESATKLRIERQFQQHYLDDFARDLDRTLARLLEIREILHKSNCEQCPCSKSPGEVRQQLILPLA